MKRRLLDSLIKLMLISATIHMALLFLFTIATGRIETLNYFQIIGLGLYFPGLTAGPIMLLASVLTATIIYLAIFYLSSKKKDSY